MKHFMVAHIPIAFSILSRASDSDLLLASDNNLAPSHKAKSPISFLGRKNNRQKKKKKSSIDREILDTNLISKQCRKDLGLPDDNYESHFIVLIENMKFKNAQSLKSIILNKLNQQNQSPPLGPVDLEKMGSEVNWTDFKSTAEIESQQHCFSIHLHNCIWKERWAVLVVFANLDERYV